jgi:hypothetical protein
VESSSSPSGHNLAAESLSPQQLSNIKAQLDLVLLSLESLTGIGSDAMLAAADQV